MSLPKRRPIDLVVDGITGRTTLGQVRQRLVELAASHEDGELRLYLATWAARGRLSSNPGFDDDSSTLAAVWGGTWKSKHGNTLMELLDCDRPSAQETLPSSMGSTTERLARLAAALRSPTALSLIHI